MAVGLSFWRPLVEAGFFQDLERRLAGGESGLAITGLVEGSRALTLALLAARTGRALLLVTPDDAGVDAYHRDLATFAGMCGGDRQRIAVLPALDADPYDGIAAHPEVVRDRVAALARLLDGEIDILLAPVRAFLQPLPSRAEWGKWVRRVRRGDSLPPDRFVLQAMGLGYRRVDIVSAPGEVSRRGGIVDVFPPTATEPVRIELFGDTVESLRSFDTDNQRSTGQLEEIQIGPAMENPPTDEALRRLTGHLEGGLKKAAGEAGSVRQFRELLEVLRNQGYWPGLEALARWTASRSELLFDHAANLVMVVDEPDRAEHELARAARDLQLSYDQSGNRTLPPPLELYANAAEVRDRLRGAALTMQELAGEEPESASTVHHVACRTARAYSGRIADLVADLRAAATRDVRTLCVMRAPGSADRLMEVMAEYDLAAARWADKTDGAREEWSGGGLFVAVGGLRTGFELQELGLSVLTERDLYGEKRKTAERKSSARAAFISDFRNVKEGDLLVHVDHGVASYVGLGRPKGGSLNRDFMILEFARGDRLFVPADRLDLVQKYTGVAGQRPSLDRLGGAGWERVKARVRKAVQSMARELLDLYARRKAATGHRFSEDTAWQAELESAFAHELTPDQHRAVDEVKRDMESPRTTDRLLVGDVGFGKTEVAVRAAFKAVMDGYQVALLAPTTVLAVQHFETFKERYAPFPVRVEMVSRFRTAAQNRAVLEELQLGSVDVLIGTHRLLSKDVSFKKLGLLVIDEEQRFGVAHKERLKQMTLGVDVLSMTATPIPRTLQMSLAGVRDLSVIETAPPGRTAIQTYMIPFRRNVLAQAMRQELRRSGQTFVVHNKIDTLPAITEAIAEMVPDARILTAHGKMNERALESVMMRFIHHEADILITTTIIENGIDIPRANTIIVNRADRFGLAQLYQLRGRVGRSHDHAYAYFVVPARDQLSDEARKRLRALQEFSELGAGFRLAAADLEIRGAGELLGARQHGHIASLGFDLYCQTLERAVQELKGEEIEERLPVGLHLGVDIKIPENYLPDAGDRLVVYKQLAQTTGVVELERLQADTEDRYGHLPTAARNLFEMGRLRLFAEQAGVKSIDLVEDKLQIRFHDRPAVETATILKVLADERGSLTPSGTVLLPAPPRGADRIESVGIVLRRMLDGNDTRDAVEAGG